MKDWVNENRVFLIFVAFVICLGGYGIWSVHNQEYNPSPESLQYDEMMEKVWPILYSPDTTCEQMTELRLQHETAKNWYERPFHNISAWEQARDMWNTLGCGNHWGLFD
jgi:predicted negative regulator of RcsB-dependent stress response